MIAAAGKPASKRHQAAFNKGVLAWFDSLPISQCPYKDVCFAKAWRAGWQQGEEFQRRLTWAYTNEGKQ